MLKPQQQVARELELNAWQSRLVAHAALLFTVGLLLFGTWAVFHLADILTQNELTSVNHRITELVQRQAEFIHKLTPELERINANINAFDKSMSNRNLSGASYSDYTKDKKHPGFAEFGDVRLSYFTSTKSLSKFFNDNIKNITAAEDKIYVTMQISHSFIGAFPEKDWLAQGPEQNEAANETQYFWAPSRKRIGDVIDMINGLKFDENSKISFEETGGRRQASVEREMKASCAAGKRNDASDNQAELAERCIDAEFQEMSDNQLELQSLVVLRRQIHQENFSQTDGAKKENVAKHIKQGDSKNDADAPSRTKSENDENTQTHSWINFPEAAFLVQLNINKLGIVSFILFVGTLLSSVYRYNRRLATFYQARSQALFITPISADTFTKVVDALSPNDDSDAPAVEKKTE